MKADGVDKRVLLVDDHPIVREGLRGLLCQAKDLVVCGEAGASEEALELARELSPDAVIVDISLGKQSGLELIRALREHKASLVILALSMHDEMIYAERALRSGANGYVMKQEATQKLVDALRSVLAGKTYVSQAVTERLLTTMARPRAGVATYGIDRLTDRELEVFRLVGMGLGSADIAHKLGISQKTVETHRSRIKEKLGVTTVSELVIQASSFVREG
jgi:DNA-binding NarL/FixJ family response regulator